MNHKQGTFRFPKAFAGILLALALVLSLVPVAARAADEEGTETPAAPTAGWESEVLDFTGTIPETGWMYYYSNGIDFMYEHAGAYVEVAEGEGVDGGDALHAARLEGAPSQVVLYSYHVEAKADTFYCLTAKVRLEGTGTTLGFTHNERNGLGNGTVETFPGYNGEVSLSTEDGVWQDVRFVFKTAQNTSLVGGKILFNAGIGDAYIDDVQIREVTNADVSTTPPTYGWQLYGWGKGNTDYGNTEKGATADVQVWDQLTPSSLSAESSDNDGASLSVLGGTYVKTVFGALAKRNDDTTYTLSFKYKGGDEDSEIRIRMDGYTTEGKEFWWINDLAAISGAAADWTEYSYTFSARNGEAWKEITFVTIGALNGDYLIDEVAVTCNDKDDPMQYVQNGSFTTWIALDTSMNVGLNATANIVEQPDGTYVYAAGGQTPQGIGGTDTVGYGRGYIYVDTSALPKTQKYKIEIEFRGGIWDTMYVQNGNWNDENAGVLSNSNSGRNDVKNDTWQTASTDFIELRDKIEVYGDATSTAAGATQTYIRRISIIGEDGTDYGPAAPVFYDYSTEPEPTYGEDLFSQYGQFENLAVSDTSWTFEGGARVVGFHHEETNDAQYTLGIYGNGKATSPAVALDAPAAEGTYARIAVVMGTEGDLNVTLVTNDGTVLTPSAERTTENMYEETVSFFGQYAVPAGTTSLQIVLENESEQYISVSHVSAVNGGLMLQTHVHAFVADDDADHPLQTVEATCQHGGSVSRYCTVCEDYVVISSTEKTDHHYVEDQVLQEPTCAQSGRVQEKCEYCGATRITPVPATGEHTYENGVCTVCGAADPNYTPDPGNPGTEDPGKEDPEPGQPGTEDPGNEGEGGCSGTVNGWYALAAVPVLAAAILLFKKRANK